jgi:hypothetical protein
MIDCDLTLLIKYRERMFPGSADYALVGYEQRQSDGQGAASRLAHVLITTDRPRLTPTEAAALGRFSADNFKRTVQAHVVTQAMAARGWRHVAKSDAGLPGKGTLLVRAA